MDFIYGKYCIQEFIDHFPNLATDLYIASDENFRKLKNLPSKIRTHLMNSNSELSRLFELKEFESHGGLILKIKQSLSDILICPLESLIEKSLEQNKALLWLPQIQDVNNLGAIIRSVVAFEEFAGLIIPAQNSVRLTPSAAKASAGNIFATKFAYQLSNIKNTAQMLKTSGFNLIALEKRLNHKFLFEADFTKLKPFVLVLGGEEKGLSPALIPFLDKVFQIPHSNKVESLNLSVATSITLYEIKRQLLKNGLAC